MYEVFEHTADLGLRVRAGNLPELFAEAAREWERVIELSPQSELGRTAVENVRLIKTYLKVGAPESGE